MATSHLVLVLLVLFSVSAKPLSNRPDEGVKSESDPFSVPETELEDMEGIINDMDANHHEWGNFVHHVLKHQIHGH